MSALEFYYFFQCVTHLLKELLGNSSINTFEHATIGDVVSVSECYSSLLGRTTILATEGVVLCDPRHATVFSVWSPPRIYNGCLWQWWVESSTKEYGVQSQEPRDWRMRIGELDRVLEGWQSKVIKKGMARKFSSDLKWKFLCLDPLPG
jgi:hypothetical protein